MLKHLPDGLILRSLSEGFASDQQQLPAFYAQVNGEGDPPHQQAAIAVWAQDLITNHPTTTLDDIFVIVDPSQQDRIASATLLIPQQWSYAGLPIAVGRPELVGTHPDYRSRGLVRALFEVVHERSAALGHQLQVITGIPYFYRQFGYTMAVDLGSHLTFPLHVPAQPAPGYQPAFHLRPATPADTPALARWHDAFARTRLLTALRSPDEWRYEITGRSPASAQCMSYQIIVNAAGEGVGYLELYDFQWESHLINCSAYVVGDESSYLETFNDVMLAVRQWAIARYGECPAILSIAAGVHESVDTLVAQTFGGKIQPNEYMWYIRLPDTIAFLHHIRPVLEARLHHSGAHRYTGEFKIGFYDLTGISLRFEQGRLIEITAIRGKDGYDIAFPWNLFWNVLFGDHTRADIDRLTPETQPTPKGALLLDILFPKQLSWVKGLL